MATEYIVSKNRENKLGIIGLSTAVFELIAEGAVEEIVTVELAGGEGSGGDGEVGAEDGIAGDAVGCGAECAGALAVVDVSEHLADLLVTAAHAVGHLDLGHVEVLRASAEGLASHSILEEGCGGDVRGREPESHVGADGLLLVGGLGLHLALPLDELLELLLVVLAEVAADGLDEIGQLALVAARFGDEIGHLAAKFLPSEVWVLELCAAKMGTQDGKKHGYEGLVHIF